MRRFWLGIQKKKISLANLLQKRNEKPHSVLGRGPYIQSQQRINLSSASYSDPAVSDPTFLLSSLPSVLSIHCYLSYFFPISIFFFNYCHVHWLIPWQAQVNILHNPFKPRNHILKGMSRSKLSLVKCHITRRGINDTPTYWGV